MNAVLSPMVSEFETVEHEASYTRWLEARVSASLADAAPSVPHDQVMAELDSLLDDLARKQEPLRSSS